MMWYWSSGLHWWGWLFGVAVTVAFWVALLWGIWYVVSTVSRRAGEPARPDNAKAILNERLARGEITPEEYQRMRDLMRHDGPSVGSAPGPVGHRR